MKQNPFRPRGRRAWATTLLGIAALLSFAPAASATTWNNIEPLKSRRADVERALGSPLRDMAGAEGTLQFKVAGGTVTIAFVSARFVANKKLARDLEGTVLQIILQHDNSNDTPESLDLAHKRGFEREERQGAIIYNNQHEGIIYTFYGGKLKTTRYTPSSEQLGRARRG
ncbi:MAG: hypothetical protein QOF02_1455 [Blastocatellia bacterium]|jgi:hypothetical protein|nr:hypothetical protein [Blastocatellia bacterium]